MQSPNRFHFFAVPSLLSEKDVLLASFLPGDHHHLDHLVHRPRLGLALWLS